MEFKEGDKVIWHYESTRGWGWSIKVYATVVKVTAKRVTIDAEMKDGSKARRSVRPDKLEKKDWV